MITIVSTNNGINVDFNGYFTSGVSDTKNGYWVKSAIRRVLNYGSYIEVRSDDGNAWLLNLDGSQELYGVDSVDTVVPTDIDHLYQLLVHILA